MNKASYNLLATSIAMKKWYFLGKILDDAIDFHFICVLELTTLWQVPIHGTMSLS